MLGSPVEGEREEDKITGQEGSRTLFSLELIVLQTILPPWENSPDIIENGMGYTEKDWFEQPPETAKRFCPTFEPLFIGEERELNSL